MLEPKNVKKQGEQIINAIRRELERLPEIEYSVITGGFAQENAPNDIDLITVLSMSENVVESEIINFSKNVVKIQLENGYFPDYYFPTDIIYKGQVEEILSGRAFDVSSGRLKLKSYDENEYITNPESDYRIWLYELITHNFDLVAGNYSKLVEDTKKALELVFLYSFVKFNYKESIEFIELSKDLFRSADLNYMLKENQSKLFLELLDTLEFGKLKGNIVIFNKKKIQEEVNKKIEYLNRKIFEAEHVCSWDLLRKEVKNIKKNNEIYI